MRKQVLALGMSICMLATMTLGCKDEEETKDLNLKTVEEKTNTEGKVSLTLWGAEEDQKLIETIIANFKEKYKSEADIDIAYTPVVESICKETALQNIHECADVFTFVDDQLKAMAASGVIRPITENLDAIKSASLEGAVEAASINDKLYAYPLTADNGYFMFYNKKYFKDSDLESLDKMVEIAGSQGKKVTMDMGSGWSLYSFFANTGMEVGLNPDGITNYCTWNNKKGDIKGTDVAQSLLNLANSAGYISGGDDALVTGAENGTVIAGVSGVWLAEKMKSIWGKNYGATKLPCYTVAGKQVQMGSYTGYKLVGVNEYSANKEWATKLAEYMISKECQELRYEMRGQGPANAEAAASDAVKSNVALTALIKQSDFGSLQRIGAAYWGPAGEFGNLMASGQKGNSSLQEIMDTLVAGITSVE